MPEKSKTLLFLTYQYPYLPGEHFIESEITHLSATFSKVLVVPARCFWWRSKKSPRRLPENVTLLDPGNLPLLSRLWFSILGLMEVFPMVLVGRSMGASRPIKKVDYLDDFKSMYKACVIKHVALCALKTYDCGSSVVGYAYWRDFSAGSLAFLRKNDLISRLWVRCHRVDIYHPKLWAVQNFSDSYSDAIFPVSKDGIKYLIEEKGVARDKLELQRLGVKIPESTSKMSSDGILRIVSCSNLVPVKRVEYIAEVVARLPVPVEWTHIGDGPDIKAVKCLLESLGALHKANFLGRLSNAEVYNYYCTNEVDWFINLSESEGVPVSIMEAMAHGIPCVATAVGGTAEIVNEGNGIVVKVDENVQQIVSLIVEQSDKPTLQELKTNARRTAQEVCSSEVNYSNFCMRICK